MFKKGKIAMTFSLRRSMALLSAFVSLVMGTLFFSACKREEDLFSYVSECRSDIFTCETEEFSLKIYAVFREHPYLSDGIPHEHTNRNYLRMVK